MTAQLALPLYDELEPREAMHAALTHEWQDLDTLQPASGIQWNPWTAATQLVREYRAHHRVIDGCDHYRLPTREANT